MPQNALTVRLTANLPGHTGSARCVAFSPDGNTLTSVGNDKTVRFWNLKSHKQRKAADGKAKMNAVAFSPDGKLLATSDATGRTRLWAVRSGELLWSKKARYPGLDCSTCVAFSPDGETVAASSFGIRLLNAETGKDRVKFPDIQETVASIAFSPDGMTLVSATVESGEITLWDTLTGQESRTLKGHTVQYDGQEYTRAVWCVAFSPVGKTIASGSDDRTIKLWAANTVDELRVLEGHDNCVFSLAFSPDGRMLASASADRTVKLWDAEQGQLLASLDVMPGDDHGAYSVAWSPTGHQVAAACADGRVLLWDLVVGKP